MAEVAHHVSESPHSAEGVRYLRGEIIAEKYRLIRLLGEGGMGSVWVARNLALDIQVAIKLIRSDLNAPGITDRLLTEARTTARLRHPSIVRVFDFGRTRKGDPFIVMELLQGETLGQALDRENRLPATYALQLLLPLADGLAAAHGEGVVHRDFKPDNVFFTNVEARLQPKILDFGIASFERPRDKDRLTLAGTVLGSPEYMAPEQARGQSDVDQRADIWSFCVVLYEMITGTVPFTGDNYNAQLLNVIEAPPPSILEHQAGDDELWSIMQRALEKDRDDRWPTMRDFGAALAKWLISRGVTEDVYGQSLKATWLEARNVTPDGLRVVSFSSRVSRFAAPAVQPESATQISVAPPKATSPVMRAASPGRSPRKHLLWLAAGTVLGGLVVAALLVHVWFSGAVSGVGTLVPPAPTVAPTSVDLPPQVTDPSLVSSPVLDVSDLPLAEPPVSAAGPRHAWPSRVPTSHQARSAARGPEPDPAAPKAPRQAVPKQRVTPVYDEDLGF